MIPEICGSHLDNSELHKYLISMHTIFSKCWHFMITQEFIPVGCVPAARWPYYAGVCFPGGCLLQGVSAPGGCVSAPGGVCLLLGVSQRALRQTPPHLWAESQTPIKTLPWPNFVAAGKNLYLTDSDLVSGNPPGKPIVQSHYTRKPLDHLASTQHHRRNQQ